MAPLNFSTLSQEPVPDGTIRKTFDAYESPRIKTNNTDAQVATESIPTGNIAAGGQNSLKLDSQPIQNLEVNDIAGGLVFNPYHPLIKSARTPIGSWVQLFTNDSCTGVGKTIHSNTQNVSEDVATYCARGSGLGNESYPLSQIDRQVGQDNSGNNYTSGQSGTSTYDQNEIGGPKRHKCFVGDFDTTDVNGGDYGCLKGGVHYPTFCQLGDYVETQANCKSQCLGVKDTDTTRTYCHNALRRLCQKDTGDPIKTDSQGQLVGSQEDYLTRTTCQVFCGGPDEVGSTFCQNRKKDYCSSPGNIWNSNRLLYCQNYWGDDVIQKRNDIELACGGELSDPEGTQHIFTDNGCAKLCGGGLNDIDPGYCKQKRIDYCGTTRRDQDGNVVPTLFSPECFNFCGGNPESCEDSLRNICKQRVLEIVPELVDNPNYKLTTEDLNNIFQYLENTKDSQGKPLSNYCGCFLPEQVYQSYIDTMAQQFEDAGYSMAQLQSGQLSGEPECIYPPCRDGLQTSAQAASRAAGNCGTCVQQMLISLKDSNVGNCIIASNEASCGGDGSIQPIEGSAALEETKKACGGSSTDPIDPDTIEPSTLDDIDKTITFTVLGTVGGIILLFILVYAVYKNVGRKKKKVPLLVSFMFDPSIPF